MTNVLFSSFYDHARMGGQRSLLQLLANLDRSRINPFVLLPNQGELSQELDMLQVPWLAFRIPGLKINNAWKIWRAYKYLESWCRQHKIDVIHADHDKHMYALTFVAKALGVSSVYHARVSSARKYDALLERRVDQIVAISNGVLPRFKNMSRDCVSVIYNGYDPAVYYPATTRNSSFFNQFFAAQDCDATFVCAGQIKEEKGVGDIIRAMGLLLEEGSLKARVVFAGSESQEGYLARVKQLATELGVVQHCAFVGQRTDIAKFLRNADVVLFPSHEGAEGMGRVPFEAMACGTPVIGTNISGVNEVVTSETGIVVPERSPAQLATAMKTLLQDSQLHSKLAQEAIVRANELFTISRHVDQMTHLFERLRSTSAAPDTKP